jgi:hypothetical protein
VSHSFKFLQRLVASDTKIELEFSLSSFAALLASPSLRQAEAYALGLSDQNWSKEASFRPRWTCPPCSLHITDLRLEMCIFTEPAMRNLIQGCYSLKHLYYHPGGLRILEEPFNGPEFGSTLQSQKHSLETLTSYLSSHWGPCHEEELHIGSLTQFEKLSVIQVDERCLLKESDKRSTNITSLLPRSLTNLMITWASSACRQPLLRFAACKADDFPHLKIVRLYTYYFDSLLIEDEDCKPLSNAFKETDTTI